MIGSKINNALVFSAAEYFDDESNVTAPSEAWAAVLISDSGLMVLVTPLSRASLTLREYDYWHSNKGKKSNDA